MQGFIGELIRRGAVRAGGVYAVVGWLLAQVAVTLETSLNLPGWFDGVVVSLLLLGFPVAILLAWAFEMTPDGVRRTRPAEEPAETIARGDYVTMGLLAIVASLIVWQQVGRPTDNISTGPIAERETETPHASATSIAVLPFVDLSPDGDQAYFSDGISEELLNVLARKSDLRVAARTSSFTFRGDDATISEIGAALNVDTVLEGSVRKSGDTIRITAQLIDARSGFHLWSNTYDRQLDDVFAVQDEIAGAIVSSLPNANAGSATISVAEARNEAFDLYLQGRHNLSLRSRPTIELARDQFRRAVEADASYAPAWAGYAMATALLRKGNSTYGDLSAADVATIALPAIVTALELDPDLAEAYVARGLVLGYLQEVDEAISAYRRAIELNPSVPDARHLLYLSLLNKGTFEDAFAVIDEAIIVDPLSAITLENYAISLVRRGRIEEAVTVSEKLTRLHPGWHHSLTTRARIEASKGNFAKGTYLLLQAAEASGGNNLDTEVVWSLINIRQFDHPFIAKATIGPSSFLDVLGGREQGAKSATLEDFRRSPNLFTFWRTFWTHMVVNDLSAARAILEEFDATQTGPIAHWAVSEQNCYPGLYIAELFRREGTPDAMRPILEACRTALDGLERQNVQLQYFERDMEIELMVLEGRMADAMAGLRTLTDSGEFISWWIADEPVYAPLRDDPDFQQIVDELRSRSEAAGAELEKMP